MKTIHGDKLIGWTDFPDNQLLRCKNHKLYESNLILGLPLDYSYLDVGSHYGDTVLTLALYAKKWNRKDIRFFAFEPNKQKCRHIKFIAKLNSINVKVINACVGNNNNYAISDGSWDERLGCCSYIEQKLGPGTCKTVKLNDIKDIIEPIGIMHIDTEGWEPKVLEGASQVLKNTMYIIAECWTPEQSVLRGFSDDPEKEIINNMKINYNRLDDIVDCERNLVFKSEI